MLTISKNKDIGIKFNSLISKNTKIYNLINELKNEGELILLGGTVRAYFENKLVTFPRDIDIVINTKNNNLDRYFENLNTEKNRFGGYKIFIDDIQLDIWAIESTFAFKQKILNYQHVTDIVKIQFISYDAIAYNLNSNEIYDNGFFTALKENKIEILFNHTLHKPLNIMKALILMENKNFTLSNDLIEFIKKWTIEEESHIDILINFQLSHYKKIYLDENQLNNILEQLS